MKIAVCVKRVPETETRIKIGADGQSIDEAGVKFVLNPYDEFAVQEALNLRDAHGGGEVVAIGMGPDATQETIRYVLAMGADRGVLLKVERASYDPIANAKLLVAELQDGNFDLVLLGKLAIDDYNHAVGPIIAELLGRPCVSAVSKLTIQDGTGSAERDIEGGTEVVQFPLPAVLTCEKGLNEPKLPALRGIMLAKKKPLEIKSIEVTPSAMQLQSLDLPPQRAEGRIVGEGPEAVAALIEALQTEAKVL